MTTLEAPTATKSDSRRTEALLSRAQAIAGSLFFVFLVMHLSNALLGVFGADTYNSIQTTLQRIYQQPVVEVLLVIAPLTTHAVAGVWLYLLRKNSRNRRSLRHRLQTWAGFFLLAVVFVHMLNTRGVGWWYNAATSFDSVAFTLWWVPGFFYPYYLLLFCAGLYHGYTGVQILLARTRLLAPDQFGVSGDSRLMPQSTKYLLLIGAIGCSAALLSFGGVLNEIGDPRDSDYAQTLARLYSINLEVNSR